MGKIVIYSLKGGCGKTTTTIILKELLENKTKTKWKIVSNDPYPKYHRFYDIDETDFKTISPDEREIPIYNGNIIYDLGGFVDKRIPLCLKHTDLVIIPTLYDKVFLQGQIETLQEVQKFNKNIILLVLKTKNKDIEQVKQKNELLDIEYPLLELRESKIISNLSNIKNKKLLPQFKNPNIYTKIVKEQLDTLVKVVISKLKG